MKNNKNEILQIALNLTVAGFIAGALLAVTYFFTAPFAEKRRAAVKEETMKELIVSAKNFKPVADKPGWFAAENERGRIGYIIPSEARGYGGTIKILIALDTNERIIDYKILSHNETPGLGERAALPEFRRQFEGKGMGNLEVVKDHDETKIDAITGATITSRAVTRAVKEGLEKFDEYLKNR